MPHLDKSISKDEIESTILNLLGRVSIPQREASKIRTSDSLDKDLNVDSLSFIELIIEIENTFNLEFDEDFLLMGAYPDVQAVVDYVVEHL